MVGTWWCGHREWHLVVVHDSVHRLDPLGVNVAIQHHPLWLVVGLRGEFAHDLGDDAIVRLLGHWVHVAVELVGGDGLRVERIELRLAAAHLEVRLRGSKGLPQFRLGRARRAEHEDAVAHRERLLQVDGLLDEGILRLELRPAAVLAPRHPVGLARVGDDVADGGGELGVDDGRALELGEEVIDEREEDAKVGLHELGKVGVAHGTHEDLRLRLVGVGALHAAGDAQHALPREKKGGGER